MLNFFKEIFEQETTTTDASNAPWHLNENIRNAVASLLIEVARADYVVDATETKEIRELLQDYFHMEKTAVDNLMKNAGKAVDDAIAIHPFTQTIRTELSNEHREQVVEMMWAVAFADGVKDANEEFLIRKVADLIGVPHPHFIRARRKVEALVAKG